MIKELTPRQIANRAKKEAAALQAEKNQPIVKSIRISIEWKKSRTWGNCPTLSAYVSFEKGSGETSPDYKASGCGYDKESTVMADLFNDYMKGALWAKLPEGTPEDKTGRDAVPYGISARNNRRYFEGGVGVNCYYEIAEYLGYKLEHTASGKTFDAYTLTKV